MNESAQTKRSSSPGENPLRRAEFTSPLRAGRAETGGAVRFAGRRSPRGRHHFPDFRREPAHQASTPRTTTTAPAPWAVSMSPRIADSLFEHGLHCLANQCTTLGNYQANLAIALNEPSGNDRSVCERLGRHYLANTLPLPYLSYLRSTIRLGSSRSRNRADMPTCQRASRE